MFDVREIARQYKVVPFEFCDLSGQVHSVSPIAGMTMTESASVKAALNAGDDEKVLEQIELHSGGPEAAEALRLMPVGLAQKVVAAWWKESSEPVEADPGSDVTQPEPEPGPVRRWGDGSAS